MKAFLIKLSFFLAPVLLFVLPPYYHLYSSGENFKDIEQTIAQKENFLIGYTHNEQNYAYLKWKTITTRPKLDVMVLGSSRALPFREKMFDAPFYNAGYTIKTLNDFIPFLEGIPKEKHPKYLIVSLDQWMFNENSHNLDTTPDKKSWSNSFKKIPNNRLCFKIWKNFLSGKAKLSVAKPNDNKIGLNAILNNTGFKNDGSMYYGLQISKLIKEDETAMDFQCSATLNRIRIAGSKFQYGDKINSKALSKLSEVVKYCEQHKIKLIAFFPPYADKVYKAMKESGKYHYLDELTKSVEPILAKHEFYDFSTVSNCGSNDQEVIDGFHGSEVTYQRMLIKMLKANSVLNKTTELSRLEDDLAKRENRYIIYKN